VLTYTYHIDENMVQAAQVLEKIIQTRGFSLHAFGYAEETLSLKNLLEDFKTPAVKQAIATINAQLWVEWVEKAQKDFEELYQQKVATEATEDLPQLSATRKDLMRYLNRLLSYLEINSEIKPEKFKPVVAEIDEIIVDVMTIARSRKSRAKNNKEENPQN
jgi:predicted nucleotidyltransferase